MPPSWSSSSFDAKNKKNIPREAKDKEIDNIESSSINLNFFYNKRKKVKDSKQIHILKKIFFGKINKYLLNKFRESSNHFRCISSFIIQYAIKSGPIWECELRKFQ